ncbi:MAG TPA: cyclic nucleotide-binding domain-containing protein [Acidimicrobiales bacterium]|nr:cyclic nucleotide-binding domain-containing protein [Acidimicrobiales bacterium]
MARRETYLDHLASVPLFSACSRRELGKIAKAGDELTVDDGHVLVSQGDAGRECFVVIEGKAVVKRGTRKVATLGPGDCVGELALLDHGPRTATVVADGPMTVFVLGARQFAGVLEDVPSLSRKVMAALASRVRELDSKLFS